MIVENIKQNVEDLWMDASTFWQDDMAKRYSKAIICHMGNLLDSIQKSCNELENASKDALSHLKEYKN